MKDVSVHVLKQFRRLSFILVLVFVLSVVLPTASVMASMNDSNVEEPKEAHEVSMEDLEDEYDYENKALERQKYIEETLEEYIINNGESITLVGDYSNVGNVTSVEIEGIKKNIEFINELLDSGDAEIADDNEITLSEYDEQFIIMGFDKYVSMSVKWSKIYFKFHHKYSAIAIGIAITVGSIVNYKKTFFDTKNKSGQAKALAILVGSLGTWVSLTARSIDLIEGVAEWGSYAIGIIFALIEVAMGICSAGGSAVASAVISFIMTLYTPSIFVGVKALIYGSEGSGICLKYRPWGYSSYYKL